jgi:hypothetical protein
MAIISNDLVNQSITSVGRGGPIVVNPVPSSPYPIFPGMVGTVGTNQVKKPEYKTRIKSRVSVPLNGAGSGAALEMTVAGEGEYVEFTLILPGRQAMPFAVHRKDIEALVGELTLDKLSK